MHGERNVKKLYDIIFPSRVLNVHPIYGDVDLVGSFPLYLHVYAEILS
jgi:hypothetical protein